VVGKRAVTPGLKRPESEARAEAWSHSYTPPLNLYSAQKHVFLSYVLDWMLFQVPRYLCEYEYCSSVSRQQISCSQAYSATTSAVMLVATLVHESVWISSLFMFHNLHVGH
jgi:hypothetical protein